MNTLFYISRYGNSEGPYSLRALELFCNRKEISTDTLVCKEGSQEWKPYGEVLLAIAQKRAEAGNSTVSMNNAPDAVSNGAAYSADGISVAFKIIGCIAMLAGAILFLISMKENNPVVGVIYVLSALLSCLACFWCAKVVELLCVLANKK